MLSILLGALVCTSDGAADVFLQVLSILLGALVCTSHCAASATSSAGAAGGTS